MAQPDQCDPNVSCTTWPTFMVGFEVGVRAGDAAEGARAAVRQRVPVQRVRAPHRRRHVVIAVAVHVVWTQQRLLLHGHRSVMRLDFAGASAGCHALMQHMCRLSCPGWRAVRSEG